LATPVTLYVVPLAALREHAVDAIPIAFPPIQIPGHGWYLDGGVRLNAPLKPAIALGADALFPVATHPLDEPTPGAPRIGRAHTHSSATFPAAPPHP
jgi:NTE family protein